ncbi:MAG: Lrp/AsnC family transcriptional regulator [Chloroflexota bacterium]
MKFDETDRKILALLLENGRISFADIGRQVGLSLPAASERVRRLEEAGIIEGYQAKLNLTALGYPTLVYVLLSIVPNSYQAVLKQIEAIPEILEACHVAGDWSLILKVRIAQMADLEPILYKLNRNGQSKSIVVLSQLVDKDLSGLVKVASDKKIK